MKKAVLIAAVVLLLAPPVVLADSFIDFGILAGAPGTISYAGGSAPLVGSGIAVSNVVGVGTPANPGVTLTLSNAVLSWTTGSSTGSWTWAGGGTITIMGGVPVQGTFTTGIPNGTILLSGTFESAQVIYISPTFAKVVVSGFVDVKDATLAGYFGLPSTGYSGILNLGFNTSGIPPGDFTSSSIGSGNVINNPLPEPGTLPLLGAGLVGIGGLGLLRRRST